MDKVMNRTAPVRVACLQINPSSPVVKENLKMVSQKIEEACDNGATLLVLPETFNKGISIECREDAYSLAEPIPGGITTDMLLKLAQERKVYICGSYLELDDVDVYNTSVLVGPNGLVGKYRKLHLSGDESYFIEQGNMGIPVFHTPIGRIALNVCLDAYYPETFRIAALQGADIVCCQFNSSNVKEVRKLPDPFYTMVTVLCMANAVSNHIFTVCCNRVGSERGEYGTGYAGQSAIIDPWGSPISGIASEKDEQILYSDIDLSDARRKHFHPANSRLAGRRLDVYSPMLGYDEKKYPKQ